MPSNGFPLHPGYRHGPPPPPGLSPLDEDVNDESGIEMRNVQDAEKNEKNEKKMPEPEVHEVPSTEPVAVSWDGPDDPRNPQNFSNSKKWVITAVCCALTINATFASSAPSLAGGRLEERFNISEEVSELVTALFLMGYVLGPVFWGSGSEMFGRRYVLLFAMCSYTIIFVGQGVATNIQTVLVLRFFSGAFAVAPLITSGGILADVWNAQGRGYATSLFGGCVFLGPSLGPLVGGFVAADLRLGWEWVYWVMMIFAGACTLFAIVCLPETYGPVLLTRKAVRLRKEDPVGNRNTFSDHEKLDSSFHGILERTLYRPWKMMANEPILMLITVYMSLVYGILYALFEAFPVIFIETRGFTITQQGLLFIGIGIGSVLTTFMNLYFAKQVNKIVPKWKGFPPAELRLYSAMIGSVMLVVGAFWLGWTGNYASVPWYVPGISTVFVGMAISAIFTSLITYIVDTYLMLAASALASNTMIRSLVGSVFPLFTVQMYHNLGINWASTLIALICMLLSPIPFLFFKYGARIRQRSKFAPCLDLKIAKQIQEQEEVQSQRSSRRLSQRSPSSNATVNPARVEEGIEPEDSRAVNAALLENIQQLTNTISEVQYLLNEAISSQAASARSQRELVDAIYQLRSSVHSRRDSVYSIGQDPMTPHSGGQMPPIPESYTLPLQAPAPTKRPTTHEWSVRLGPIDLSAVTDLHGTALSFARMTRRGNQISPQVRGRKGGPHVLIMSWKTEEEARAFYEAWSEEPPADYATLSVVPNF